MYKTTHAHVLTKQTQSTTLSLIDYSQYTIYISASTIATRGSNLVVVDHNGSKDFLRL